MGTKLDTLTYSARPRVVLKYLGQAGVVLAGLQTIPIGVALASGDYVVAITELAIALLLFVLCVPLRRLPNPEQTLPSEALAVVSLAFVFASVLLWPPLWVGGVPAIDAFFEAVSAVTTTGLTTLDSVAYLPTSLKFLRSWAQWYGGLGIVVFVIALLANHPIMARRLMDSDTAHPLDMTTHGYARKVAATYGALTLFAVLLLWVAGADPLQAVTHALSGISTGGFSTFDASLGGFESPFVWYGAALIGFLGAVSLPLYSELRPGRFRRFFTDEEFIGLAAFILIAWLLLAYSLYRSGAAPLLAASREGALLAIFAQTTTGFSTTDVGSLEPFGKLVLIVSMMIGGNMGSTAGGIKMLRVLLFLRLAQLTLRRVRAPAHAVVDFRLAKRRYEDQELLKALFYVLLFVGVCVVSWGVFLAAGYEPIDSLLEVVSAAGTVGLSTGITRVDLETPLKLLLVFDMLAGRLEIVALLILIHPRLWFGSRLESL